MVRRHLAGFVHPDAIKFYVVLSAMVLMTVVPHDWADVITHTDGQ
jgi:hypothetical protein